MNAKDFGQYLKSLRKQQGHTLVQLKDLSGLSQPYLSQIENGQKGIPSPEALEKLAPHLGVSHTELMFQAGYISMEEVNKRFSTFLHFTGFQNGIKNIRRKLMKEGELIQDARVELSKQLSLRGIKNISIDEFVDRAEKEVTTLIELSKTGRDVEGHFEQNRALLNVLNHMMVFAGNFDSSKLGNQLAIDFNAGGIRELSDYEMFRFNFGELLSEATYKIIELIHQIKEDEENKLESVFVERDIERILTEFAESLPNKENPKELLEFLNSEGGTYAGQTLSEQDRQRILDMLKLLFPDRNEEG